MTSNPFPLSIVEKVNSPALLAWFQQFGEQGYVSAEDANKYTQALRFLYENMAIATLRRPTRFIEPPTASMIVGDENNSVVVVGDADSVITIPAGIYPIDAQLEITSLSDAVTHVNFPGGSSTGYSDIPFGATLVMKQISLNYWVCNFRFINTGSYTPVTLTNILGAGDRTVVYKNSDHLFLPADHTVQFMSTSDMDYYFNDAVTYPTGANILIKPGTFNVRVFASENHNIVINGEPYISASVIIPVNVSAKLNKVNTTDWILTFEYGLINTTIPTIQQVLDQGSNSIDTGLSFTSDGKTLSLEPEIGISYSSEFSTANFGVDSVTFVDNFSSNFSRFGLIGWQGRINTFDFNVSFETPTQNNNINFPNKSGILVTDEDLATKADLVGGVVPSSQLPTSVDEILEGYFISSTSFEDEDNVEYTPASNKYYLDLNTNKTYRWSGSLYTPINEGIALGETSSTAYRGDRGKSAYDHSQITSGNPHGITLGMIGGEATDNKENTTLDDSAVKFPTNNLVKINLDLKAPIAAPTFSGLVTSVGTTQTGSSATGVLNLSQTWNTTGNPTALKLNVTNTASGASSLLFDFQINGSSLAKLNKAGLLTTSNGLFAGSGAVQASFYSTSGFVFNFGNNYMYGATGTATVATSGHKTAFLADISWSPTSGTSDLTLFNASPTINQTGGATGKVRGFYFNPTLTSAADAIAIDIQKGRLLFSATNTASGTTGDQTINKISGTVNFGAGASSLVVTNNLVTANSIVIPCVYGSDATASSARITTAAGSFTINLNAAATAETTVAFFVIN